MTIPGKICDDVSRKKPSRVRCMSTAQACDCSRVSSSLQPAPLHHWIASLAESLVLKGVDNMAHPPSSAYTLPPDTFVPLACSSPSSPTEHFPPRPSSALSIRSLLSHIGRRSCDDREEANFPFRSKSTSRAVKGRLAQRRAREDDTARRNKGTFTATETSSEDPPPHLALPETSDPIIGVIHAEWYRVASSLKPEQRQCLLGAVCLGVIDPVQISRRMFTLSPSIRFNQDPLQYP